MSHYVDVVIQMDDTESLVKGLGRVGFEGKVEVHDVPQNLYGYQGDKREQKAHIILRRKYVGAASNDIGFERKLDGSYIAHISEFDSSNYNQDWLNKLSTYYGVERAKKEYTNMGLEFVEDLDEKQRPRLRAFF